MLRFSKLFVNFLLSGIVFSFLVLVLVFYLNPFLSPTPLEVLLSLLDLAVFYLPLWFVFITLAFNLVVFFTEKKYPIGFVNPPSPTFFLSFTVLVFSVIAYFNYEYYYDYFSPAAKLRFLQFIMMLFVLIALAMVFVLARKRARRWVQFLFSVLFLYFIILSMSRLVDPLPGPADPQGGEPPMESLIESPRKVRLVIMDALSLNDILTMSSEQRLLNFNLLMENGVRARMSTFRPNLDAAMIDTLLSGREPALFDTHSNIRFQFRSLPLEFDKFPRYLLFRKQEVANTVSFYKDEAHASHDLLQKLYSRAGYRTSRLIQARPLPRFTPGALARNSIFVQYFSPALQSDHEKFDLLKKSFFLDESRRRRIPELKGTGLFYSVSLLDGLSKVKNGFFHYHRPQPFSSVEEDDIERFGWVIDRYYDYYDTILGNLIATTGENELLVIVSLHEPEPLPVWRRMIIAHLERRDIFVYKSLRSMGTVFFYEKKALRRNAFLDVVSIYDIFPTLAYYAGFPLTRDFRGLVIKEIFSDDFLAENPIYFKTN